MAARLALALIRAYKLLITPALTGGCRFVPSCSEYADQAIRRHGLGRGSWLSLLRIAKCRPFGPAGYDPVPSPADSADNSVPSGGNRLQADHGRVAHSAAGVRRTFMRRRKPATPGCETGCEAG